ncbi:hypothetical protein GOODEAATRI_029408, partial [Goodea atripinnis]
LLFDMEKEIFPMVVQAVVDEGEEHLGHSHILLATFEKVADDEISDNSAECVVCLSDVRDTLILPCRHLCLCNACADTLRYQANCCPICRLLTPDSENLTLSSSGAIDQSPCTGTPLSSTITSPEDPVSSSLAQSVMSMASSHSQHSHISADTMSSMSGSYMAGTEAEPVGANEVGNVDGEEDQDAPMESRAALHQDGVRT